MVMDKGDKDLLKSITSKEIFIIFYKIYNHYIFHIELINFFLFLLR